MGQEIRSECGHGGGCGLCGGDGRWHNFSSLFGHLEPRVICFFWPDVRKAWLSHTGCLESKLYLATIGSPGTLSVSGRGVDEWMLFITCHAGDSKFTWCLGNGRQKEAQGLKLLSSFSLLRHRASAPKPYKISASWILLYPVLPIK